MSIMTIEGSAHVHPFFAGKPETQPITTSTNQLPDSPKPRRGRPPGSKNKRKLEGVVNQNTLQLVSSADLQHAISHVQSTVEDQGRKRRKISPTAVPKKDAVWDCGQHPLNNNNENALLQAQNPAEVGLLNARIDQVIPGTPSPKRGPDDFKKEVHDSEDIVKESSPPSQSRTRNVLDIVASTSTPPRLLQLKNGKFPSPKAKREAPTDAAANGSEKGKKSKKSLVVTLKYDKQNLSARITAILQKPPGSDQAVKRTPKRGGKRDNTQGDSDASTHPFFGGKDARKKLQKKSEPVRSEAAKPEVSMPSPRKATACTPGKLRAEVAAHRSNASQPVFGHTFGAARAVGIPRQAGLKETAWPSPDTTHIRGLDTDPMSRFGLVRNIGEMLGRRKGKQMIVDIQPEESVLSRVQQRLKISARKQDDSVSVDGPRNLRKPRRLLIPGQSLREATCGKLRCKRHRPPYDPPRSSAGSFSATDGMHAAVANLISGFDDYLSPFDRSECEIQAWVTKYQPKTAEDVLQIGPEAVILRDWLKRSTTNAVQSTSSKRSVTSVGSAATGKAKLKMKRPKKRRKTEDIDDFIVSSGDEADQLDDLQEIEVQPISNRAGEDGITVVRGGSNVHGAASRRVASAVVISGPHGCGKTAAVYAVAKELGFQVFEINSGSRRSGRDILDKIGDMTENHLVQQVSKALADPKSVDTTKPIPVEVEPEKPDPKQNKLASFFGKAPMKSAPQSVTQTKQPKPNSTDKPNGPLPPRPRQQQKQSLILFEEVDVLFEEDKQFWLTVMTLAINSKRPIILTCSDESLVPLEALSYHAILRFKPPPSDIAVDYLLTLTAREGHLLDRAAVETLYTSRHNDLRACIQDLDFWCQLGVGDCKGGLEWLYQRWPTGSDLDKDGRTIRVASENTYVSGQGWISHDIIEAQYESLEGPSVVLEHLRSDWGINGDDLAFSGWTSSQWPRQTERTSAALASLDEACFAADCTSAADLYSRLDPHALEHYSIDPTVPELSDKQKLNYTISRHVVQDDGPINSSATAESLACTMMPLTATRQSTQELDNYELNQANLNVSTLEKSSIGAILVSIYRKRQPQDLTRTDFSHAFDPLAEAPGNTPAANNSLAVTSFDREFRVITTDLAPYIRIIAAYDVHLESQRLQLSNLLSVGGSQKSETKSRKTRASRSALEGGKRETTRRERWFDPDVNLKLILGTGGNEWAGLGAKLTGYTDDMSVKTDEEEY